LATGLAATETCSEVCLMLIDKETELTERVVPVGYAMPGMTVCLVDEARQPAGPNRIGEIAVKSPYLALGYWQRPDLTSTRFLPATDDSQQRVYLTGDLGLLRADGAILHKGRNDFQLKIRGNRVDIGEIEAALLTLDWVKQAAVAGVSRQSGDDALVAYLVLHDGLPQQNLPTVSQLRKALTGHLPAYMIPAQYVFMSELPLTVTGKIDRTALPAAPATRPGLDTAYLAPRTPIETTVAALWGATLEMTQVGIDDSFLELGGSSLQAMRIVARVNEEFGINCTLAELFARHSHSSRDGARDRGEIDHSDRFAHNV
jgi:acyl-coenzyme A synthetase/AMP-(fatty) acid ligase/acyl carrier protein